MKKMKQWRCKDGHILGYIQDNRYGLPQLILLREAMDMDAEHPNEVDLFGPLDGKISVKCSICDDVQEWQLSIESLLSLFSQLSDKDVFEFSQRLAELSKKVLDIEDPSVVKEVKL